MKKKTINKVCPKCMGAVSFEKVSPDYFCCCLNCDEDFYEIELLSNNIDDYKYDELKQMVKAYEAKISIPCNIDEIDGRISEIDKLGF